MPESKLISRHLTTTGLTTGTESILMADAVPVTYSIKPTGSEVMEITRMLPWIRDNGAFSAEKYGNIAAGIVPGIQLGVYGTKDGVADTLLYELTDTHHPITNNADWAQYCYDANVLAWGSGDQMLTARWTFAKSGKPMYLSASKGQYLAAVCAGTCSTLVEHHILVQGYYITQ